VPFRWGRYSIGTRGRCRRTGLSQQPHCRQLPLPPRLTGWGRTYDSKEDAVKALSAYSPGVANEAATDSDRSTELPLFDLAPYRLCKSADAQVIAYKAYTFQYNEAHEQAAWVLYRINAEQLRASVSRTDDFRRDGAVTTGSATLADYRLSGYDRGHPASAAAMAWSQEVMSESFYLSNMSPQDPGSIGVSGGN